MGCCSVGDWFLRWSVGKLSVAVRKTLNLSLLDPPHVCCWSWRTPVVSDAMGYFRYGCMGTLGRISYRWSSRWSNAVAMAWCS